MKKIFVNLKRFDVPKIMGGICPVNNPKQWIEQIVDDLTASGAGSYKGVEISLLLPESLIITAMDKLAGFPGDKTGSIRIGSQGVFREDVTKGGNFGAFTTNRPASAVSNLNCKWSIIGHSEERKDKLGIIEKYDPLSVSDKEKTKAARDVVDRIINEEVKCALNTGLNVLLCIGETSLEKGDGSFAEQKPRIEAVLGKQLDAAIMGISADNLRERLVIGYEPIWAIGLGKTPPGADYIGFVSGFIKKTVAQNHGFEPYIVYGGGLKEENAGMISGIDTIDGGLVALTRFSGDIGFFPEDLKKIIDIYMECK